MFLTEAVPYAYVPSFNCEYEYMFFVDINSISYNTQGHKHKTSSCLYNISTKFDIIVR